MRVPWMHRLGWILLIALITWAGIWWQTTGSRWTGEPAPFVQTQWSRPLPAGSRVALDPSGSRIAILTPDGSVHLLDGGGQAISTAEVPAADSLSLTQPGDVLLAYRRTEPAATELRFFHLDGSAAYHLDVREPIADAAVSQDGRRAACATTSGEIYSISLGERPTYRRWKCQGTPQQVHVTPDGSRVVVATADPPGVWAYGADGRFSWKCPNEEESGSAALYPAPDGHLFACVTVPAPLRAMMGGTPAASLAGVPTGDPAPESRLVVLSANGRQQWGARVSSGVPFVALTDEGRFAGVTYVRVARSAQQAFCERQAALFSTPDTGEPRQLWAHGGPFYDPRLVSIAGDGSFLATRDGRASIYFFDRAGEQLWRHRMPSPIVETHASADGRTLLVVGADHTVSLLTISGGGAR